MKKTFLFIIIVLAFFAVVFMQCKEISALKARVSTLEQNYKNIIVQNEKSYEHTEIDNKTDELEQMNEELEYELSLDEEEYYKKMAEKNGYLDPDATHYTNDYSN